MTNSRVAIMVSKVESLHDGFVALARELQPDMPALVASLCLLLESCAKIGNPRFVEEMVRVLLGKLERVS